MAQITKIYYNKLIRDNIPEKIKAKGQNCEYRPITDQQEFIQELFKKISEEADTLSMARSREEFIKEYCDLIAVLETIIDELGISHDEIKEARTDNRLHKGKYDKRHFLLWSDDVGYESSDSPQGIPV